MKAEELKIGDRFYIQANLPLMFVEMTNERRQEIGVMYFDKNNVIQNQIFTFTFVNAVGTKL